MNFAEPVWLFAGAAACLLLLGLYRHGDVRRRADLARFAAESLLANLTRSLSPGRRTIKRTLMAASIACAAMALARPYWGFYWEESHRKGLDLLIAVDTSKSMLAQDVRPDRLARAKMAVEDLLEKIGGDRVGLIAFAGTAFLQCPMTLDHDAFRQSLEALDVGVIPRGGTDIASAIHEAIAALEAKGEGERILILLTDGEDLEGQALDAAREASKVGLKIFTVGVGSAAGELVPIPDGSGGSAFARDSAGKFVKSHLDEGTLRQVAEIAGGLYEPLGAGSVGLETIYEKGLAPFTRHDVASRMRKVPIERFQWPLALSLFFLLVDPLIGLRRRRRERRLRDRLPRPGALINAWNRLVRPAAILAVVALCVGGRAFGSPRAAEKAYNMGQYDQAAEAYGRAVADHPDEPVLNFNHGAAQYKSGNFEAAGDAFSKALKSDEVALQQDSYYNLGNVHYRIGQRTETSEPAETIKKWEEALQSYQAALQLKPSDTDAKFNHDLVKRRLDELKQKQQQNQSSQQKNDQNQNQQQNNQQKQDQQQDQKNDNQNQDSQKQDNDRQEQAKNENKPSKDEKNQSEGGQQQQQQQQEKKEEQEGKKSDQSQGQQQGQQEQQQAEADGGKDKKENGAEAKGPAVAQNPQDDQPADTQRDDRARAPGEMSREEARQLLDSLKSDDRKLPMLPYARRSNPAQQREPTKDW